MCDAESDGLGLGGVVICVHDEIRLGEEEEEGGEEDEGDSLISKSIVYMYVCVCVLIVIKSLQQKWPMATFFKTTLKKCTLILY